MSSIWLACCAADAYRDVQREINARESGAQMLRLSDLSDVRRMMRALPAGAACVALADEGAGELADVVAGLAADGHAREILVLARSLDPERIAAFFAAGATEVVAAESRQLDHMSREAPRGVSGASPRNQEPPSPAAATFDSVPVPSAQAVRDEGPVHTACPGVSAGAGERASVVAGRPAGAASPWKGELEEPAPVGAVPPQPMGAGAGSAARSPTGSSGPVSAVTPVRSPAAPSRGAPGEGPFSTVAPEALGAAPVVTVLSGRGGTGKTTLLAGLALCAAQWGLRAAVVDADLMFGNAHELMGAPPAPDLAGIAEEELPFSKEALARAALLVAPGLTVWGPCDPPERAELAAPRMDALIAALRREADVVLVDTASPWGDAVAAAVAQSERCLVVADLRAGMVAASKRVIGLAAKLGVPRTKMTCVVNRYEGRSPTEEFAMRLEMEMGLASKTRVAVAGAETCELLRLGRAAEALGRGDRFASDVREFARLLLRELGCVIAPPQGTSHALDAERRKFKLPWKAVERP